MTVGDWSLRSAGQQVMVAGEREMVFLPSDGATEDQAVAQGGRADHHRGVRHCVRRRDRARRGITVLLYSCVTEDLPTPQSHYRYLPSFLQSGGQSSFCTVLGQRTNPF